VKPDFVGPVWDGGSVCPLDCPECDGRGCPNCATWPADDLVRLGARAALRRGHNITLGAVRDVLAAVLPEIGRRRHMAGPSRCPKCCEHGLPYSAEDQRRFGASGWCGWCDDVASGDADPIPADKPQWLCPHGVGKAKLMEGQA